MFHSALVPKVVGDVLRRTIDEEHSTPFSLSGHKGDLPLLGVVGEGTFRLRKRRYYLKEYARQFYARYEPEQGGTRIEGYFNIPWPAKYFTRIWLAFAVLLWIAAVAITLTHLATGNRFKHGDLSGLIVMSSFVSVGIMYCSVGKGDESFIKEYVQSALVGRIDESQLKIDAVQARR